MNYECMHLLRGGELYSYSFDDHILFTFSCLNFWKYFSMNVDIFYHRTKKQWKCFETWTIKGWKVRCSNCLPKVRLENPCPVIGRKRTFPLAEYLPVNSKRLLRPKTSNFDFFGSRSKPLKTEKSNNIKNRNWNNVKQN